ncbi:MAG: DHH family phosphoesterase [Eubacterium sp.]|nr:DHH family phosphoesterase [Eubacterium sp.]
MTEKVAKRIISANIPIPMCIVSSAGKIISANRFIDQVFLYKGIEDADFFALTGIKIKSLLTEDNNKVLLERNGRKFRVVVDGEKSEYGDDVIVFFKDVTKYEDLKEKYESEKVCVCRISVDNYDQFTDSVTPETGMSVTSQVDRIIRKWAADMSASLDKIKDTLYNVYFQNSHVDELLKNKFSILDDVRKIETGADFPLTLSMGIGINGSNILETSEYAAAALDLALGRGGDQAVVKDQTEISYFGGKTQSIEKGSKGKSRIIAHALRKLIEQSDRVLIMGHQNADMDAFGSALGIYRICINSGTEAHIVIDEVNDSMQAVYNQVRSTQNYNLISTEKANSLIKSDTLLVVVDTQRPSYLEAPELLDKTERVVVIDHHRRAEDFITGATLSYIETYASSTAELVTEMLQYVTVRKSLVKLEAEALLAGMTVDTNRFAVKTGVRTFEAAAWLRRAGADTTEVKRFFQIDAGTFRVRAKAIADAKFHDGGIATSICEGHNQDAQVINSQVADELLNIKGIKASFVAGINERGVTCISARSLGDINVQVLLEKIGGGGHLNTAGAQVTDAPDAVIQTVMSLLEKGEKNDSNS